MAGGLSQGEIWLPQPCGTVTVRIGGGVSGLRWHRPAGVAARVEIRGGASQLGLDPQYLGAVGGPVELEAPGYSAAAERYAVDVHGGVSQLSID